jgi:hypothetical protein
MTTAESLEDADNQSADRCRQVGLEAGQAYRNGVSEMSNPYADHPDFAKVWTGGHAEAQLGPNSK